MRMNRRTRVFTAALGVIFLLPGAVMAACTLRTGPGTGTISFGRVVVQRDTPVGTILASQSIASGGASWTCDARYTYTGNLTLFSTLSPYGNSVYSTNIPGVGMRIHFGGGFGSYFPIGAAYGASSLVQGGTIAADLIKTSAAAAGSGNLTNGALVTFKIDATTVYTLNLTGTNTIAPVACSVSNSAINVPMGDMARKLFTGVGHKGPIKQFFITLRCDADTKVKMTIDAVADSSAAPGVIALTSAGSPGVASGVGIQLTHSGAPVVFGSPKSIITSAGGVLNIPLIATYYQTSPTVRVGPANAQATFTMTYN